MRRERQLLGPGGTRGVASLISGLTLRERRALHEAVRRRILSENDGDTPAASADNQLGDATVLGKNGTTFFEKTDQGWKTTVKITVSQVLKLVKPEAQETVREMLKSAKRGDIITINAELLIKPELANDDKSRVLKFQKVDDKSFIDPVPVSEEKITAMLKSNKIEKLTATPRSALPQVDPTIQGTYTLSVGNSLFFVNENTKMVTLSIPGDDLTGFRELFGPGDAIKEKIAGEIAQGGTTISLSVSDALDQSIMGRLSRNIFSSMGIGKLPFKRVVEDGKVVYKLAFKFATLKGLRNLVSELESAGAKRVNAPPPPAPFAATVPPTAASPATPPSAPVPRELQPTAVAVDLDHQYGRFVNFDRPNEQNNFTLFEVLDQYTIAGKRTISTAAMVGIITDAGLKQQMEAAMKEKNTTTVFTFQPETQANTRDPKYLEVFLPNSQGLVSFSFDDKLNAFNEKTIHTDHGRVANYIVDLRKAGYTVNIRK